MRPRDWPERLAHTIERYRHATFSEACYCLTFAAECTEAVTGIDYLDDWRGLTLSQALDRLEARGGTLADELRSRFGAPLRRGHAMRGDLVVLEQSDGTSALGICVGARAVFLSDAGLAFRPLSDIRLAFRT